MKNLNRSSISVLLAGGGIALMPLDNLTEILIAVAIAFLILSGASYVVNQHKSAK
jgi:hypothetical protein